MKGISFALACLAVVVASGCTVHQTEAPGLTGPSEAALSVGVTATPDAITQDGSSVSTISVVARDANGQLLGNRSFRLDMMVNGKAARLRHAVEPHDHHVSGRASHGGLHGTCGAASRCRCRHVRRRQRNGGTRRKLHSIVATSLGSDYSAAASHVVQIRLVPSNVIVAASSVPSATFSVATPTPTNNSPVLFDASASCAVQPDAGVCSLGGGTNHQLLVVLRRRVVREQQDGEPHLHAPADIPCHA